jgi:hypothetical protein
VKLSTTLTITYGLCLAAPAFGGSIFVTGHDPDFHATIGPNATGAQHIIQFGLDFARNGNTDPILYLQSNTDNNALGDHTDSEQGLIASGYTAGTTSGNHYVKVNFTQFLTADFSLYSAIFVPSDHGGSLTGDDLQALNSRSADILTYLNAGGGLVALAEDGERTPATTGPQPANFGFLPFLVTAAPLSQTETGNTVTPFGASLGLMPSDINGNFSHNIFTSTGGMSVVDQDAAGEILSLGFRGTLGPGGAVPEPASWTLAAVGLGALTMLVWRGQRSR